MAEQDKGSLDTERLAQLEKTVTELTRSVNTLSGALRAIGKAALLGGEIDLGKVLALLAEAFGLIQACKNKDAFAKICEALKELCKQLHGKQFGDIKFTTCEVTCDEAKIKACTEDKVSIKLKIEYDLPDPLGWATFFEGTLVINFADFDKFANEIKAKNILKKAFKEELEKLKKMLDDLLKD